MGSKASRNTSIEALRLVAVAGIAIFHTFQSVSYTHLTLPTNLFV